MDLETIGAVGTVGTTLWSQKEFLKTIYGDLAQPGVRKVGQAVSAVIEYGSNYLTFLGEKQKELLAKRLEKYKENLNSIPEENIMKVPPEIGIPVFQRLTYTTNDDIASLFIELLTNASSSETIHLAQPRFINMIENMSADEAKLIAYMKGRTVVPYCFIKIVNKEDSFKSAGKLTGIEGKISFMFHKNLESYLDNLVSLGVIEDKEGLWLTDESSYNEIERMYGGVDVITQVIANNPNNKDCKIEIGRSYYRITRFGIDFIKCCTKLI